MEDVPNATTPEDWTFHSLPYNIQVVFGVLVTILFLSLSWNFFCCLSKCCSEKEACQPRKRRSHGSRHMEDNPIYGNISYVETDVTFTEVDPPQSSALRNQRRVKSDSQSKNQDCYANLTLKAPRQQSGHSSPQIQYSAVVHLEEAPLSEKEDDGNTDAISTMSDLYASVQTQRATTVNDADSGEGYANHL